MNVFPMHPWTDGGVPCEAGPLLGSKCLCHISPSHPQDATMGLGAGGRELHAKAKSLSKGSDEEHF